MLIFENTIKSPASRKTYLYHLNKFMAFFNVKDYDGLASLPQEKLQIMMEDYVMHLKKMVSPNAINLPIAAVKAFLDCNDIELRWSKINRLKPARVKKTGGEAWLTSEISKMLTFTTELRTKTLIHFIASSGLRIGALEDIKMKHITQIEDCKSILVYDGTNEEYVTFLTPEASSMFDDYIQKRESDGERITSESPVFRSTYQLGFAKVKPSTTNSLKEIIRVLVLKSGLRINQVMTGKRYNKQADHGFRKRFNTVLKTTHGVNISLAEKMMGHSVTVVMDNVYLVPTVEQLFDEFKKAIPSLTISDDQRTKMENMKLKQEKSDSEKTIDKLVKEKIEEYTSKFVKDLEKMMEDNVKKASIKMEEKDLELLRKISENNAEFKELKENYVHPERMA
jgi:integrase/recombinase XerD